MRIRIAAPRNRNQLGKLELLDDGGVLLHSCECLCRSDDAAAIRAGNPRRDPLQRMGDLPTGAYRGTTLPNPLLPVRSYGPHRPISLGPVSGDALQAKASGRSGLLIHGGDENPALACWRALRPTHGCCRVRNINMGALNSLMLGEREFAVEVVEVA